MRGKDRDEPRVPMVWTNGLTKRPPEAHLNWQLRQGGEASDTPRRRYDPYADI